MSLPHQQLTGCTLGSSLSHIQRSLQAVGASAVNQPFHSIGPVVQLFGRARANAGLHRRVSPLKTRLGSSYSSNKRHVSRNYAFDGWTGTTGAGPVTEHGSMDNGADIVQQGQPSSPSGMVALMEAWGHLSSRLQQPNAPLQDTTARDATTQLILSALKLAVRSLSRVPNAASSGLAMPNSISSIVSSDSKTEWGVQRSLALAAALAELYANGLPLDAASIAAGIVADAVDVAALHIRTVQSKLGSEVAGLVHDVLAVRHAPDRAESYNDATSSALRGWLLTAYDVRACAIEVVWRWLALAQPPAQAYEQQLLAMEALNLYCPLGHALGLGVCATGLEDAAFKVLFPSSYASTARQVLPYSAAAADMLAHCQQALHAAAANDAQFRQLAGGLQLLSRTKSLYSIMRKLLRLQDPAAGSRRLGEMYDLLGLRAVVLPSQDLPESEANAAAVQACYRLQELAHQLWAPLPWRTKDYIAHSKSNGYQSLHSTLQLQQPGSAKSSNSNSSSNGTVLSYLELQVRTAAMHAAAEGGDAAHAGYKGRLEKRQVRHLQQWTSQLQRRIAASQQQQKQQQLLLLAPPATGSTATSADRCESTRSSSGSDEEALLQADMQQLPSTTRSSRSSSSSNACGPVPAVAYSTVLVEQQHSSDAAAAAAALFRHLDLDGDGQLSLYELAELLFELGEGQPSQPPAVTVAAAAGAAGAIEQQGSGVLQLAFSSSLGLSSAGSSNNAPDVLPSAAYAQEVLELIDTNNDGLVSMSEFLDFYVSSTFRSLAWRNTASSSSNSGAHNSSSRTMTAASTAVQEAEHLSASSASSSSSNSSSGATAGSVWGVLQPAVVSAAVAFSSSSGPRCSMQHVRYLARHVAVSSQTCKTSNGKLQSRLRSARLRCCAFPSHSSNSSNRRSISSNIGTKTFVEQGCGIPAVNGSGVYNASISGSSDNRNRLNGSDSIQHHQYQHEEGQLNSLRQSSSQSAVGNDDSSTSRHIANGPTNMQINGAATAAFYGDDAVENDKQQQQQQGTPSQQPVWSSAAATAAAVAAMSAQVADRADSSGSSSSDSSSDDADEASYQQQYQQQLEMELTFDEEQQQQRRWLRQQQQKLPTLLEDAAAGRTPCYVLSLLQPSSSSSSNNGSISGTDLPVAEPAAALKDMFGRVMWEMEVPCLGPLILSNAPQVFRSADVILDAQTPQYDRLALTVELVKPTGNKIPVLQARNVSRVVRGRLEATAMRLNGGKGLMKPHKAAVQLHQGDVVELCDTGAVLVVREAQQTVTHPAVTALERYCGVYAEQQLGTKLPVQQAIQEVLLHQERQQQQQAEQQQQQQKQQRKQIELPPIKGKPNEGKGSNTTAGSYNNSNISSGASDWTAAAAADALENQLRQISRLVRSNVHAAERELAQLAVAHPTAAGPWFVWAQLAASNRRPWMARHLFRAAAVCQQQQLEAIAHTGATSDIAEAVAAAQQQQKMQQADGVDAAAPDVMQDDDAEPPEGSSSSSSAITDADSATGPSKPSNSSSSRGSRSEADSAGSPAFRASGRLVQVLRVWARLEWDQRVFGPARRLWRLAANEAFKFPYNIAAAGGGAVLHSWAIAEYERDNILNARIVIGEALRKCPRDAAVAVLAANIEAAAGEVNAARALFVRAYQLNKADKQLYMAWPKLEGATGNYERARLLFQYGLSLYPSNTKILNVYACFEEGQGNVDLARELHRRALGIDSNSITTMHNRVSWAKLELEQGNVDDAQQLLLEGLDAHPGFPGALLLMAQVQRQQGNLDLAEAYARRAQKVESFSVAALGELRFVYAARGEKALESNLRRQMESLTKVQEQKQAGKAHSSDLWTKYFDAVQQEEQQSIIKGARRRKKQLGLIRHNAGAGQHQQQQFGGRDIGFQQREQDQQSSDIAAAVAAAFEQLLPDVQ